MKNDENHSDTDSEDFLEFLSNNKDTIIENNEENEDNNIVFGIDLGTTNSCISYWKNNKLEIIPDEYGNKTIPSYVAYTNVSKYIGNDAKNQKDINSENVFYEVKRLIGKKFNDESVKREKTLLSYKIEEDKNGGICLKTTLKDDKLITPEEISSNILMKLKSMAKFHLKKDVKDVVITIPANFNDGQRQATKDAAEIAGLNCLMLINEPTAAALSYGMMNRSKIKIDKEINEDDEEDDNFLTLLVYDFGGGTLDVSLLVVYNGIFEVKASTGNTNLGGSDFDDRIMTYCIEKFKKSNNIKKLENISLLSLQKLRLACENAKQILSNLSKTYIAVKSFYNDIDLYVPLTRINFEKICMDLFLMCMSPIEDILDLTDTEIGEIDEIILVGGMTKMPYVRNMIKNKFKKDGNCSINPNEAISAGASIQGYLISNKEDPFTNNIGLIDVTSLSLGVETIGDVMDVIVPRTTILPCEFSKIYTTDTDNVDSVLIKIYEGERSMTKNNFFVGEFELGNIPLCPRGYPQIEVKFKIDTNGIINVEAKDLDTNETNSVTVTGNKGRMTREEIDELIKVAREQEHIDEIDRIKKLNHYEISDLCDTVLENIDNEEFMLKDNDKDKIKKDIEKTKKWLNEMSYKNRDYYDYEDKLKKIKNKYGVLILRGNLRDSEFKATSDFNDNMNNTNVYGDEDDEDAKHEVFEKLEDNELGILGMTDNEKDKIKETRKNLMDLCISVFDIIDSGNLSIEKDHKEELSFFIDDILLWIHSHEKPTENEYNEKINEINEACNKILKLYEDKELFKKNEILQSNDKNSVSELENLSHTIKIMLENKSLPIDYKNKEDVDSILEMVENNIEWIFKNIHNRENLNDNEKLSFEQIDKISKNLLDNLNNVCKDIYDKNVSGIDLSEDTIIKEYEYDEEEGGTSILNIIQSRKDEEFNKLIEEDD